MQHQPCRVPPRLEGPKRSVKDLRLPVTEPPFTCDPHSPEDDQGLRRPDTDHELFGKLAPQEFFARLDIGSEEELVRFHAMVFIGFEGADPEAKEKLRTVLDWMESQPEYSAGAFLAACQEVKLNRWDVALGHLKLADPSSFADPYARHYHHLRGLAELHLGRVDEARKVFERGSLLEGECALEPLIQLTRPMADRPKPRQWGPRQPLVRQLMGAIRTADLALETGDFEAARGTLERPLFLRAQEVQSLARLAAAWLGIPAPTPTARFRKRLVLALFLDVCVERVRNPARTQIFLPGSSWDRPRLDDLAERCRGWLDGTD